MRARAALGVVLGLLARLWLLTLRFSFLQHPAASDSRPWVLAFFHGQQFAMLRWPRRRATAVLVSLSPDGEMQAHALPRVGLVVRRGSSSRGGARGLAALIRLLRQGLDAAFAVDGPRGPRGLVQPGAIAAARHARGVVVPIGCASSRSFVLKRSWDQFELPLPFARVAVVVGSAIEVTAMSDSDAAAQVRLAIESCNKEAHGLLSPGCSLDLGGGEQDRGTLAPDVPPLPPLSTGAERGRG